jgi:PTH1 family peptidyl-tRNA hydrolase
MKLIIGLGNPGKAYQKTRHNIGWQVLDFLAGKVKWHESKKAPAFYFKTEINSQEVELFKPTTFMNESGRAVAYAFKKHNLKPADLIVVHDDKDLPLGKIKVQTGSSSAGHNGVQSIIDHLKTKDFIRVRIGIASDNPKKMADTSKFVLNGFSLLEKSKVKQTIAEAAEEIKKLI